ncbi:MAG: lysine 2,3-aminomutase [Odoribacter sp.]
MKKKYQSYDLTNYRDIPQVSHLSAAEIEAIEVVGRVLPFQTNSYVTDELIDWEHISDDPMFTLTFPRREMLENKYYVMVRKLLERGAEAEEVERCVKMIRRELNPSPSAVVGDSPILDDLSLTSFRHKYPDTLVVFPSQGQSCGVYCTFCYHWTRFCGMNVLPFVEEEVGLMLRYVLLHPEVSEVLLSGGDPMMMSAKDLGAYLEPLLLPEYDQIRTIRIGTKTLGCWPYRYLSEEDSEELLALFGRVTAAGKRLVVQAHLNHPVELSTAAAVAAVGCLRAAGVEVRTLSPLLRHINDAAGVWAALWRRELELGCVPAYLLVVRDAAARRYFEVPLVQCWTIFRDAFREVGDEKLQVKGPCMSSGWGKVQLLDVVTLKGKEVFVLSYVQACRPEWVGVPFYALREEKATCWEELKPAFGQEGPFFESAETGSPVYGDGFLFE